MARSRSDDYDDRDDDRYDDRPAPFPGIVMAAGVIWICVGCLSLINMMATFALGGANPQAGNQGVGNAPGQNPAAGCCAGLVGIAFLVCGYQTVRGKSKDTLGNGIGSIVFGLLQLAVAAAIGLGGAMLGQNPNPQAPPPEMMIIIAVFVGASGCTLILAGTLALVGRGAYRE